MQKKLIIGIVAVLFVVGGIFLWQQQKKQYSAEPITPTKWSQAGDYKITETPEGTLVENQKAGFSFKVPEGWATENRAGSLLGEYVFNMRSPSAKFEGDESGNEEAFIRGGCVISLETEYQKSTVDSLKIMMSQLQEVPKDSQRIVQIATYPSLQTNFFPPPSKYLDQFGNTITIETPVGGERVVRFGIRYLPKDEIECRSSWDRFINTLTLE